MSAISVIALIVGSVVSLASSWVMVQYTRRLNKNDQLEERVRKLELNAAEQVGKESLREIIRDELAKWELCLMKDGRIGKKS